MDLRLCSIVEKIFGLKVSVTKEEKLIHDFGNIDSKVLADRILTDKSPAFVQELVNSLTVNYTFFNREHDAIIRAMKYVSNGSNILIAPTSTGEEAYTVSMYIKSNFPMYRYSITGIDVCNKVIEKAKLNRYRSTKNTCDSDIKDFFDHNTDDGTYSVKKEYTDPCKFLVGDLSTFYGFDGEYDLIFSRNVWIYFTPEMTDKAIKNLSRMLKPGGIITLSYTEHIPEEILKKHGLEKIEISLLRKI